MTHPVHIVSLYRSQEGHLVVWLSTLQIKSPRFGVMYDATTQKQLATPAEMASVKDYATQQAMLAKHRLIKIPFQLPWSASQGAQLEVDDLSGPRCKFPYDDAFSVETPQGSQSLYLVIWKRPQPAVQSDYGCSYDDNGTSLRTLYHSQNLRFYWTTGVDKYLVMDDVPWVVRFDAQGRTHFFDHRQDAGLVRAEAIQPLVEQMQDADTHKVQALVNKAETIIEAQLGK